jgi:hypothetical protein
MPADGSRDQVRQLPSLFVLEFMQDGLSSFRLLLDLAV